MFVLEVQGPKHKVFCKNWEIAENSFSQYNYILSRIFLVIYDII